MLHFQNEEQNSRELLLLSLLKHWPIQFFYLIYHLITWATKGKYEYTTGPLLVGICLKSVLFFRQIL